MELRDIKRLVELIKDNELTEFELERKDFRLTVKRAGSGEPVVVQQSAPVVMPQIPAMPSPAVPGDGGVPAAPAADAVGECIVSPMVGTFYRSPSPELDAYVSVGQHVDEDTVVCIVEAMKVMNEIKAERSGVIKKLLVEDGTPVEYNQPLFEIEPA